MTNAKRNRIRKEVANKRKYLKWLDTNSIVSDEVTLEVLTFGFEIWVKMQRGLCYGK